jgi:cytochrome c oxidase subunit 2
VNWGLPENASTFGEVDQLYQLVLFITGLAFALTQGALLYVVWKYRARPGGRAQYIDGNPRLELAWAIVPGVILFALAVYQYSAWTRIKTNMPTPDEAVQVELSPRQFRWPVRYPGADNLFDTEDDLEGTENRIVVPVNEPILVTLRAQDVIHSFFVPELRVKQDAIPGQDIQAWFEATRTGEFPVLCAELCGPGHYTMRAAIAVVERDEFEAYLAERQTSQAEPDARHPSLEVASNQESIDG